MAVLAAQADAGDLDGQVLLGRRPRRGGGRRPRRRSGRRRPVPGSREAGARVGQRRAEPLLDPVATGLDLGLEPRGVVHHVRRPLLGRQSGPAQLLGLDHPAERLAKVGRRPGISARVRPVIPALCAVEPREHDLEKLGLLDQADGDQPLDPKIACRHRARGSPAIGRCRGDRRSSGAGGADPGTGVARPAGPVGPVRAVVGDVGRKTPQPSKLGRAHLEPADDSGDPDLDHAPAEHRRQELGGEGALLGRRQSLQGLDEAASWMRHEMFGFRCITNE